MSRWDHRICERCWFDGPGKVEDEGAYLVGRRPNQLSDYPAGRCCWCGGLTITAIFARKDPNDLRCGGEHDGSDDD